MEAELRAWWLADAGVGTAAEDTLERLLARHREPHRHYHGVTHLHAALECVRALTAAVPVPDPVAVHLATWYHDAVYDPTAPAGSNEDASADVAADDLAALGLERDRIDEVARLVRLTAGHLAADDDVAGVVLCDADLAVLGADPAEYAAYVTGIRAEYAHLGEHAWRTGRRAVLEGFLARSPLYRTEPMHEREARARANLVAELAALDTA